MLLLLKLCWKSGDSITTPLNNRFNSSISGSKCVLTLSGGSDGPGIIPTSSKFSILKRSE